jgi:uncharacterized protein (DUF58 family)
LRARLLLSCFVIAVVAVSGFAATLYLYQGYSCGMISTGDSKKLPFDPVSCHLGKEVRITGKIELCHNIPRIVINSPSQVETAYLGLNYP